MPGERKHHTDKWRKCVEEVMAKGHDKSSAVAICTTSLQEAGEPIFEAAEEFVAEEIRHFHLRAALGRARTEIWDGREHLVVPVIALQEGVIHAVNAENPEFVPASVLEASFDKWNGHPIVVGHPVRDGKQCSAHDAGLLAQHGFGIIRMAKMGGPRLGMEVLADPARLEALGQLQLLEDLRAGNPVEVSVGVYARTLTEDGEYKGKKYKAKWMQIVPDHLAFLPGGRGACSLEMGCGAHRAASHVLTEEDIEVLEVKVESTSLLQRLLEKYKDCEACGGSGSKDGNPCEVCEGEGMLKAAAGARNSASDMSLIQSMHDQAVKLGAKCEDKTHPMLMMSALEGKTLDQIIMTQDDKLYSVTCEVKDGAVVFTGEPKEVKQEYVAAEAQPPADDETKLKAAEAAAAAEADRILMEKAAAGDAAFRAACGCQGEGRMTPEMKAELIRTLVADKHSGFTAGDEKMLEAASDDRLESFKVAAESRAATEKELKAAAERKLSNEEFMAAAPPELKALIDRQQKQETELKAALVTELKAAQQEYSETELSVMPVADLQRMARLAKVNMDRIDYSGRALPVDVRAAAGSVDDYAPPAPYDAPLKVLQGRVN